MLLVTSTPQGWMSYSAQFQLQATTNCITTTSHRGSLRKNYNIRAPIRNRCPTNQIRLGHQWSTTFQSVSLNSLPWSCWEPCVAQYSGKVLPCIVISELASPNSLPRGEAVKFPSVVGKMSLIVTWFFHESTTIVSSARNQLRVHYRARKKHLKRLVSLIFCLCWSHYV